MTIKYIHFTDSKSAKLILESEKIWQASFGPKGAVFAVADGGAFVPKVQLTKMGRASNRNIAVVFTTSILPDQAYPEEVMWHINELPIKTIDIIDAEKAKQMLNDSIPIDEYFDMLKIPLHPAFNISGNWARMPEKFESWIPGADNKKYIKARKIWIDTKNIEEVYKFWSKNNLQEVKKLISLLVSDITTPL